MKIVFADYMILANYEMACTFVQKMSTFLLLIGRRIKPILGFFNFVLCGLGNPMCINRVRTYVRISD